MVFRNNLKDRLNPFRPTLGSLKVEKRTVNVDATESTEDSFFQSQEQQSNQRQRQRQEKSIENDQSMIPAKLRIRRKNGTKPRNLNGHAKTLVSPKVSTVQCETPNGSPQAAPSVANPDAPSAAAHTDGEKFQLLREHYFYGSSHAIQIYCVIIGAIWFRRIWILHGITLILLKVFFWILVSWGGYFLQLKEARQGVALIKWLIKFGLSTAEGAIDGKNVSKWMTGSSTYNVVASSCPLVNLVCFFLCWLCFFVCLSEPVLNRKTCLIIFVLSMICL